MEKRLIDRDFSFVANDQTLEVAEPGNGPFDPPSFAISSQWSPVLSRRSFPSFAVRADQFNAALRQSRPVGVGVARAIGDQSLGLTRFTASTTTGRCSGNAAGQYISNFSYSVPEPSSIFLFGIAGTFLFSGRRRSRVLECEA